MFVFSIDINIVDILINLVIVIFTSAITAKVALKHFYKQELWLRKERKYSEIIDKLCVLMNYYGKQLDIALGVDTIHNPEEFSNEYNKACTEMEKIRYSIGFIINSEVNVIIDNMIKDFTLKGKNELQGDWFSHDERVYCTIKDAIKEIIEIANKDLKNLIKRIYLCDLLTKIISVI